MFYILEAQSEDRVGENVYKGWVSWVGREGG